MNRKRTKITVLCIVLVLTILFRLGVGKPMRKTLLLDKMGLIEYQDNIVNFDQHSIGSGRTSIYLEFRFYEGTPKTPWMDEFDDIDAMQDSLYKRQILHIMQLYSFNFIDTNVYCFSFGYYKYFIRYPVETIAFITPKSHYTDVLIYLEIPDKIFLL